MRYIILPALLLILAGCGLVSIPRTVHDAGGDAADQAYALLAEFNVVDAEALELMTDGTVPPEAVAAVKHARAIARPLVDLISEAGKAYRAAEARLNAVPDQTALDEFAAALQELNARLDAFAPKVRDFIALVGEL